MRNTTFKLFVSFLALFALAFVLAGCSKHEHDFGEWKETKAPTCTEAGEETRSCECGEKQTASIDALGHEFLQDQCLKCGEKKEFTPETCPHYHHEIVKGYPATCTEDGLTDGKKCSVCKEVTLEQEVITAPGHKEETIPGYPATCTENGLTDGKKCLVCKEVTLEQEVITAPGHNYVDGVCDSCSERKPSEGLSFVTNGNGTCYVSGIGTCTDTDIVIPEISPEGDKVTSIGEYAFLSCTSLESVVIGDSVESIGDEAFYRCDSLVSVVIPDSVESIGERAFSLCTSLESVAIPNSVTSIGDYAFYWCDSLVSVVIPDNVTSIGSSAISYCTSLESVVIGDSVTSIGDYAFSSCTSLTSIVIPDSVTSIGSSAFYLCRSLVNIEVSPDNSNYESIDGNLYTKGGIALIQYAIGKTATSFTIPDSVESIGDKAFSGCSSLESVEIPDSVESIGDSAFRSCSSLRDVYYTGTEEEWGQISIGSYNYDLTSATIHYNYVPEE